jgi:hypothetical protein
MAIGRHAVALCLAAALVCSGTLLAQQVKKLSDAQRREVQEIVKIIDSAAAAPAAPNDLSLTWAREDVLKAQGNQEYVPFTVMIDPSKVSGNNVIIYWRVVSKTAAPAPAAPAAAPAPARSDEDRKAPPKPDYAYEDISTAALQSKNGPIPISRSFAVAPGAYEVTVVVKEPTPQK